MLPFTMVGVAERSAPLTSPTAELSERAAHRGTATLSHRTRVRLFISFTVALAIASAVLVALVTRDEPLLPQNKVALAFFVVLLVVGELNTLKWLKLHDGGEITTSWAFSFSILLMPAPMLAVVAMALASSIGDLWHRKPAERVLFNVAQTSVAVAAAVCVIEATNQDHVLLHHHPLGLPWVLAVLAAAFTMFTVNGVLTCTVMALHEGTKVRSMLRRGMFLNLVSDGALVSLAPIFVVVADRSLLLLPLAVSVAGLVHYNTRAALASEHEANHDVLTELPNRRAFLTRIENELDDQHRCALVLIDLDGFKDVNDRLGHQTGDLVLAEIGNRLRQAQKPAHIAARLGGDEFAVLITRFDDLSEVTEWADSVRAMLARPCMATGFPVTLTSSVGIAIWPDHATDSAGLFQAADLAMYSAKKVHNAVQVYRESEASSATGRLELLAELEAGIHRGELQLWYQPQVNIATGRVVAFEALVRWRHSRFGLVLPGDFMPIAEHTDLMGPITERVVSMAVRDATKWRRIDPAVRVAVNTSARNLHDLSFPKLVAAALDAHGADPALLELEITENTVISQPERTRAVLESLGELGVRLSIDDFGTGYSSLAHLRSLPVHAIKIDRTFVRDISDEDDDQVIVRSIIELAHNLGLDTVAEGVETGDAANLLGQYGCDHMQGFLVHRPMPFDEAVKWLIRTSAIGAWTMPESVEYSLIVPEDAVPA